MSSKFHEEQSRQAATENEKKFIERLGTQTDLGRRMKRSELLRGYLRGLKANFDPPFNRSEVEEHAKKLLAQEEGS